MKKILLAIALTVLSACAQSEKEMLAMIKACETRGGEYKPDLYNGLIVGGFCYKNGVRFNISQSGDLINATKVR